MMHFLSIIIFLSQMMFAINICIASTETSQSLNSSLTSEQIAIENEILGLEKELQTYRHEALNKEIDAQKYMLDNRHRFAEDIQDHENDEQHIFTIKERLNQLYLLRERLKSPKSQ